MSGISSLGSVSILFEVKDKDILAGNDCHSDAQQSYLARTFHKHARALACSLIPQELQEQIPAKPKPGAIITAVYELSGLRFITKKLAS